MSSGINLGEDLEREILVRLPAKSLTRFKCVQRSWNALFKTRTFVARQKHIQSNNHRLMTNIQNRNITLLSSDSDDPTPTHIPLTSLFPNHDDNDNNNEFPTRGPHYSPTPPISSSISPLHPCLVLVPPIPIIPTISELSTSKLTITRIHDQGCRFIASAPNPGPFSMPLFSLSVPLSYATIPPSTTLLLTAFTIGLRAIVWT